MRLGDFFININKVSKEKCNIFLDRFPILSAFFAGGLLSLSLPPFSLLIAPLISFFILLTLVNRHASFFRIGWAFGASFMVGTLYWFASAVKISGFGWIIQSCAAFLLPSLLGLFYAVAVWGSGIITKTPLARALSLAFFWSTAEWSMGHVLTGLPWGILGYAAPLPLLQYSAVFGIYGVSLIWILCATLAFTNKKNVVLPVWLVTLFAFGVGVWHLTRTDFGETETNIRLIQGSIPQEEKWLTSHFEVFLDRHIALSLLPAERPLHAVIWTEASVPTVVERYPNLLAKIATAAPQNGFLIFGSVREDSPPPLSQQRALYSSVFALSDTGAVVYRYDKAHLVPFGEYLPLRQWVNLPKLTAGLTDYTPGSGPETVTLPGLPPAGILVCYEIIFPGQVKSDQAATRPQWFINVTNDAWFGHSSGPYQHLRIARVRAIEEGVPVVRVANNGISAVIDPLGRIRSRHSKLDLDEIGFIDAAIPRPTPYQTPFSQYGHSFYYGMMLLLGGFVLFARTRRL